MTNKYSYLLIGDPRGRDIANKNSEIMLSGLYLWSTAFERFGNEGVIDPVWRKDDLECYDIVHINYTPSNMQLPTIIRDQLGNSSSTKLVINVDLDLQHWGVNWAYNATTMMKELQMADMLFHVEEHGAEVIDHMLGMGKCFTLPHPVDVSGLFDHIRKERGVIDTPEQPASLEEQRMCFQDRWEPFIATMYHRYTADTFTPWLAQKNIQMRKVLFGYTPGKHAYVPNAGLYDQVIQYQGFKAHINELSKAAVGVDLYSGFTYGRSVVEMAGLCVPAVASNTITAARHLFPETCVQPYDIKGAEAAIKRLLEVDGFADNVIKQAHDRCGFYSLKSSYKRFVECFEIMKS